MKLIKSKKGVIMIFLFSLLSLNAQEQCDVFIAKMDSVIQTRNIEQAKNYMKIFKICIEENTSKKKHLIERLNNINYIYKFYRDTALVHLKENSFALVNREFEVIKKLPYDMIYSPNDCGVRSINHNLYKGYINSKGELILEPKDYYLRVGCKHNDIIIWDKDLNLSGAMNCKGQLFLPIKFSLINCAYDNLYHIIDDKTYFRFNPVSGKYKRLKYSNYRTITDNRFIVEMNGKKGIVDENDNIILEPEFNKLEIHDGYIVFEENNKYGVLDFNGNVIFHALYDAIINGIGNSFIIKDKGVFGVGNTYGNVIVPVKYSEVKKFDNRVYKVSGNGRYGLYDLNGKMVVPIIYNNIEKTYNKGLITVVKNRKFGLIDYNNNIILPLKYDYISSFVKNLATISLGNKEGLLDSYGKIRLPIVYDKLFISRIYDNWYRIEKNQQMGVINGEGKYIIPLEYSFIGRFNKNGISIVKQNGLYGLINLKNNFMISPKYKKISEGPYNSFKVCNNLYNCGLYDSTGKKLYDEKYEDFRPDGLTHIVNISLWVKVNNKWGLINQEEEFIIPPKYDILERYIIGHGYKVKMLNSSFFYINRKGECVKDCQNAPADHPRAKLEEQ